MGMAASQARFLSLTARKSNTEYEGQQVNQERTTLANESSNLYAQLTRMDLPSPPNTADFYKQEYSFVAKELNNGQKTDYKLLEIYDTPDGTYAKLSRSEKYHATTLTGEDRNSISTGMGDPKKDAKGNNISIPNKSGLQIDIVGKKYPILLMEAEGSESTLEYLRADNSTFNTINVNEAYENVDNGGSDADSSSTCKIKAGEYLAYYEDENGKKCYISAEQLLAATADNKYVLGKTDDKMTGLKDNLGDGITSSRMLDEYTRTVVEEQLLTSYETNDIGRTTSITVPIPINVEGKEPEIRNVTYQLDCVSVEDEEAYHQAMLDYEYEQAKYNKAVEEINAKTEKIQAQDKTLELELKQLDTEQSAISTELDAVKKVVDDNVESTFKTFG